MATDLHILDLPPEVLLKIFCYLPARDVSSICQSCKLLLETADQEIVWLNLIKREFGSSSVPQIEDRKASYKDIYTKILYVYKGILGLWQPEMGSYGGLVYIKVKDGEIVGEECFAPIDPYVHRDLRVKKLFTIKMSEESSDVDVLCYRGYSIPHPSQVVYDKETGTVRYWCTNTVKHRHVGGKQYEFESWLEEETGYDRNEFFIHGKELLLMKFLVTTQLGCTYDLTRIRLPSLEPSVIVQPGLFKGNYGGHGIEIVMLSYLPLKNEAHCTKITGDPNVPANKISLFIDLSRPMVLTANQQESVDLLLQIDIPDLPPESNPNRLEPQPFLIPQDCFETQNKVPKTCIARFHAEGQIASHDFSNPSRTPGHWVVFSEDTFGFLWLELKAFSLYSRVKEEFR